VELLTAAGLTLGKVTQQDQDDRTQDGKVITQLPPAATSTAVGASVDVTLARFNPSPATNLVGSRDAV
jgi:beta-lactam-binding protein with PASTA domain